MSSRLFDAIVVGAGPAGCSAASWLAQLGLRGVLVDREDRVCSLLHTLDFPQDWVLGAPRASLNALGRHYTGHLEAITGVETRLGHSLERLERLDNGLWQVETSASDPLLAHCVVMATGLRPRRPERYFGRSGDKERVFDVLDLHRVRSTLAPGRVLVLGGGDNAVENALDLDSRGHQVTLVTRNRLRAQPALLARMAATPHLICLENTPAPTLSSLAAATALRLAFPDGSLREFDYLVLMYGFEPEANSRRIVLSALQSLGRPKTEIASKNIPGAPEYGLFVCGDAAGNIHPCVQTALASGVHAAKSVQRYRQGGGESRLAADTRQTLVIDRLRFGAPLGWSESEKGRLQQIEVSVALRIHPVSLNPDGDDLAHVLDYGAVRQLVIAESTRGHTNLVETLVGRICARLQRLPGVHAVRVQCMKLEIFDDCRVGVSAQSGDW